MTTSTDKGGRPAVADTPLKVLTREMRASIAATRAARRLVLDQLDLIRTQLAGGATLTTAERLDLLKALTDVVSSLSKCAENSAKFVARTPAADAPPAVDASALIAEMMGQKKGPTK